MTTHTDNHDDERIAPPVQHSEKDHGKSGLSRMQKIACSLIALLAVGLIGISGYTLAIDNNLINSDNSLTADVSAATDETSAEDIDPTDASETQPSSEDSSATDSDTTNDTTHSSQSSGDSGAATSSSQSSSSEANHSNASSQKNDNSTSSQKDSSSGSSSNSSSSSSQSSTVTVSVSVSSSSVGNPVSGSTKATFNQGATVYDALCATGLSINSSRSAYGIYVSAIGGLAEKEHGSTSGWMYSVNGTTPMTACSNYRLEDGDKVQWYYVTSS